MGLPALRLLARNLIVLIGKSRSARTLRNSWPTAPVAPAMATFTDMAAALPTEPASKGRATDSSKRLSRYLDHTTTSGGRVSRPARYFVVVVAGFVIIGPRLWPG